MLVGLSNTIRLSTTQTALIVYLSPVVPGYTDRGNDRGNRTKLEARENRTKLEVGLA